MALIWGCAGFGGQNREASTLLTLRGTNAGAGRQGCGGGGGTAVPQTHSPPGWVGEGSPRQPGGTGGLP